ncbi:MAG: hypothetical protein Q9M91_04905 [Candidatus Dojkabacteria bacterium]|nr:hypothetical protein [Candidatus Dojkabacteria bacterium]MDQ7021148.1 hypothetical protein [Candidatus Dojkabacteria bacterium]
MNTLEESIRDNAIYSKDSYKETDVASFLSDFKITKKYAGQLSRVFEVEKTNWLVKEAKWDVKFEPFKPGLTIPSKIAAFLDNLLGQLAFSFLPKKKEILRQYELYLLFSQYFGFFDSDKRYYHPDREVISLAQVSIRDTLLNYRVQLEEFYNIKLDDKINLLHEDKDIRYHNFLPKEYLLAGKSISKQNKGRVTSFIFQEFVKGDLLHDVDEMVVSKDQKLRLVLMMYLLLLMNMQTGVVPDTRPRYNFFQAYNWLTKTDNVIISKNDVKFIDTRWFYDTKNFSYLILPSVIPKLAIRKAKTSINKILKTI